MEKKITVYLKLLNKIYKNVDEQKFFFSLFIMNDDDDHVTDGGCWHPLISLMSSLNRIKKRIEQDCEAELIFKFLEESDKYFADFVNK